MKAQGLNTYVYAPKDDYKHRAYWREMYNAEEIRRISSLIKAAKENDVVFFYAISPGLDISFANEADVEDDVITFKKALFKRHPRVRK